MVVDHIGDLIEQPQVDLLAEPVRKCVGLMGDDIPTRRVVLDRMAAFNHPHVAYSDGNRINIE
jgi:hypothetical protein